MNDHHISFELFSLIDVFDARIKSVEKRLKEKTNKVVGFLEQQQGIGPITAVTLYAEIGDFTRFKTSKQLSNFGGLTPRNMSSGGKDKTGGLIGERNRDLRCVLIEAAHRLIRYDKEVGKHHTDLVARGKQYNVAVAAVASQHSSPQKIRQAATCCLSPPCPENLGQVTSGLPPLP